MISFFYNFFNNYGIWNLIELHINQQNSLLKEIKENLMPNIETASNLIAKT